MFFKRALVFIFLLMMFKGNTINYLSTTESIGWNGAYSSVGEGFEGLLYNPAGIYATSRKYGLNLFGSYGVRMYNNIFSTDDVLNFVEKLEGNRDITNLITDRLDFMSDFGMDTGIDVNPMNLMTYMNFQTFGMGISLIMKSSTTGTISKPIFEALFQNLDVTEELDIGIDSTSLTYLDLNYALSTRPTFLEKLIPIEAIYTGISGHFYLPIIYTNLDTSTSLNPATPDPDTGIYTYDTRVKGTMVAAGNQAFTLMLDEAFKLSPTSAGVFTNSGSGSFGLGLDAGFILKFNSFIKYGFSVNDLGFMVFPAYKIIEIDETVNVTPTKIQAAGGDMFAAFDSALQAGGVRKEEALWFMPGTTVRTGVAITPVKNRYLDVVVAGDISLSDFNRLINDQYVSFNFSTGVKVEPRFNWFAAPIITSFNYNSQANVASFAFATGLHFGPMQFGFAVKGLEFLILGWGAKEVAFGFDFKLEF